MARGIFLCILPLIALFGTGCVSVDTPERTFLNFSTDTMDIQPNNGFYQRLIFNALEKSVDKISCGTCSNSLIYAEISSKNVISTSILQSLLNRKFRSCGAELDFTFSSNKKYDRYLFVDLPVCGTRIEDGVFLKTFKGFNILIWSFYQPVTKRYSAPQTVRSASVQLPLPSSRFGAFLLVVLAFLIGFGIYRKYK